jgi:hypothetical protein
VDSSKLGVGEIVAGISALALFLFMFLPWYGIDSVGGFGVGGGDANAWEVFSFVDILLFLVVVAVVGLVLVQMAGSTPDMPSPPAQLIAIAGVVAFVLILFRLIFTPGIDTGGVDIDVDLGRKIGIFLGLIASAGIAYGGWRGMNEPAAAGPGVGGTSASAPPPPPPPAPTPAPPQEPPRQEPPSGGYSPPQQ